MNESKVPPPPDEIAFMLIEFNFFFDLGMKMKEQGVWWEYRRCKGHCRAIDKKIHQKLKEL